MTNIKSMKSNYEQKKERNDKVYNLSKIISHSLSMKYR